jgi:hypothetical protein
MKPGILSGNLPLAPLKRISPSRFQSLKECALRELWAVGGPPNQLPAAPAARLGSAIHRLLEEAGKGLFREGGRTAIEKRWDGLVGEAESVMQASWLERHFLPLKNAVSDFEVRKLRAIQLAQEITESFPAAQVPPGGQGPRGTEVWVSTPDGLAGGYIDQVEASPAGPVLRDYKSGHILEEGASAQGAKVVKEAYEVQLKLYAAIYASTTGVWPARLELVPLQGPVREVAFTASECQELVRQAREAIVAINAILRNNAQEAAETMLAAPSPAACRYCLFRPSCAAYKRAREHAVPEQTWPDDLWGTVREKRVLGNGKVLLAIQPTTRCLPLATVRGLSPNPDRHPALPNLQVGNPVAVFGLKGGEQGATFRESAWTVIYRPEAAPGEDQT